MNTQGYKRIPPKAATTLGIAVPTMVTAIAARNITVIKARIKTGAGRGGRRVF